MTRRTKFALIAAALALSAGILPSAWAWGDDGAARAANVYHVQGTVTGPTAFPAGLYVDATVTPDVADDGGSGGSNQYTYSTSNGGCLCTYIAHRPFHSATISYEEVGDMDVTCNHNDYAYWWGRWEVDGTIMTGGTEASNITLLAGATRTIDIEYVLKSGLHKYVAFWNVNPTNVPAREKMFSPPNYDTH